MNGWTSISSLAEVSVHKGSVLGPTLWNIYFDNLLENISTANAFNDDCTLSQIYSRQVASHFLSQENPDYGDIMFQSGCETTAEVWEWHDSSARQHRHPQWEGWLLSVIWQSPSKGGKQSLSEGDAAEVNETYRLWWRDEHLQGSSQSSYRVCSPHLAVRSTATLTSLKRYRGKQNIAEVTAVPQGRVGVGGWLKTSGLSAAWLKQLQHHRGGEIL